MHCSAPLIKLRTNVGNRVNCFLFYSIVIHQLIT